MDASIFGLRFKSNAQLQPDAAELAAFLRSPRAPGAKEARQDDLAAFVQYVDLVERSETGPYADQGRKDFGEHILLSVLSHTHFFRRTLRIAIEEYLYHHHQLLALDFSKPEKFVLSAEEEVNRLNPKKKDDQQKIARLQTLIEQRNKDLEVLARQRRLLTGELCHIAAYVHDNIVKIQQLCEGAISSLAKLHVGGKKTEQLIEDLKAHFKDKVREHRQMGVVTPEYLESVKAEVAQISHRLTQLVLGDLYAVTGVYEGFYEHAKKNAAVLKDLIARAEQARKDEALRDNRPFTELERALIALVAEFRPVVKAPAPEGTKEHHEDLLREKRREMLDHVFELLKEQYRGGRADDSIIR